MKIVHVLKRIETIDKDVKDLRKLEKSLQKDKSFSTPIYMTIEKQINILVDERVKLLGLQIQNPPASLAAIYDEPEEEVEIPTPLKKNKRTKKKSVKKAASKSAEPKVETPVKEDVFDDDMDDSDDIPLQMLTQDSIDSRFDDLKKKSEEEKKPNTDKADSKKSVSFDDIDDDNEDDDDTSVKLLDIALNKGSLEKEDIRKEKKRVKFFRDNFPGSEY